MTNDKSVKPEKKVMDGKTNPDESKKAIEAQHLSAEKGAAVNNGRQAAPGKFQRVATTARNFSSDRPRRDRRNRRGDRTQPEAKQYEEQTISVDRVARVVKGGRRFRFKALVVVGDRKNKVGVGVAKGQDVQAAVTKAANVAKKNMITVPIVNTTIPHEIETKVTGARVLLKPAAPGTGVIAGGVVRSIIGVTSISNLLTKSLGSANKVNIAYATIEALSSLVPKDQWVVNKKAKISKTVPETSSSKSQSKKKPEPELTTGTKNGEKK